MKNSLIPLFSLILLLSCNTQDICDEYDESFLIARFRTLVSGEITDTTLQGFSVFGIREGWVDRLLYDSVSLNRIALPFDPNNDYSRSVIFTEEKRDTLLFQHTSEAYLLSYNCGFAARFTLEEPINSGGMIVNLDLRNASVDGLYELDKEHLWIYF